MLLRAAITVPFIVLQQCQVQGAIRGELKVIANGCGNDIAGAVGLLAVFVNHVFTRHLRHVWRLDIYARAVQRCSDGRAVSLVETGAIDVTQLQHTP